MSSLLRVILVCGLWCGPLAPLPFDDVRDDDSEACVFAVQGEALPPAAAQRSALRAVDVMRMATGTALATSAVSPAPGLALSGGTPGRVFASPGNTLQQQQVRRQV